MSNSISLKILTISSIFLSSCSNISLENAAKLSGTGQEASSKTRNLIESSANIIPETIIDDIFSSEISKQSCTTINVAEFSEEETKELKKSIQLRLKSTEVFDRLTTVYSAFGTLARYNSASTIDNSFQNLSDSLKSFSGEQVGDLPKIVSTSGGIFGWFVEESQKDKLRDVSIGIKKILTKVKEGFSKTKDSFLRSPENAIKKRYELLEVLWECGVLDASPLIESRDAANLLTYKASPKDKPLTSDTEKGKLLLTAVKKIIALKKEEKIRENLEVYNSIEKSLEDLITEHQKFESGVPIDLEGIQERILKIKSIISRL